MASSVASLPNRPTTGWQPCASSHARAPGRGTGTNEAPCSSLMLAAARELHAMKCLHTAHARPSIGMGSAARIGTPSSAGSCSRCCRAGVPSTAQIVFEPSVALASTTLATLARPGSAVSGSEDPYPSCCPSYSQARAESVAASRQSEASGASGGGNCGRASARAVLGGCGALCIVCCDIGRARRGRAAAAAVQDDEELPY